ncbi:MAG TPA: hypothetical protein VGO86_09120 [Candidatus Dormibacteraeota bacterium]|jgi:hypothetical protein
MSSIKPQVTVRAGGAAAEAPPRSQLEAAYQQYRLERQGNMLSESTLVTDDALVSPFLAWVAACGVRRFADLDVGTVRAYRAQEATRIGKHGRKLRPYSVFDSHRTLFRTAEPRASGAGGSRRPLPHRWIEA